MYGPAAVHLQRTNTHTAAGDLGIRTYVNGTRSKKFYTNCKQYCRDKCMQARTGGFSIRCVHYILLESSLFCFAEHEHRVSASMSLSL